jgi:hypothetical protein
VLMADARCAAETGTRPLFTQDDLEDTPLLLAWLNQPLEGGMEGVGMFGGVAGMGMKMDGMFAGIIRLLRVFGAEFHKREYCPDYPPPPSLHLPPPFIHFSQSFTSSTSFNRP